MDHAGEQENKQTLKIPGVLIRIYYKTKTQQEQIFQILDVVSENKKKLREISLCKRNKNESCIESK